MIRFMTLILLMAIATFTSAENTSLSADNVNKAFIGYAYAIETQDLLYTEHHSYQMPYIHQVQYREVDGEIFATKVINYKNSYYAPDFMQENLRNGENIKSIKVSDRIKITYQENRTSNIKQNSIRHNPKLIIDAGFDHFITKNWQTLNTGNEMTIDYLIPSSLDHYELRIKKEFCENENHYCFSISASSFFISLFSSELKLTYSNNIDIDSSVQMIKLVSFQGRSNICDSEGKYQDVSIVYKYDES